MDGGTKDAARVACRLGEVRLPADHGEIGPFDFNGDGLRDGAFALERLGQLPGLNAQNVHEAALVAHVVLERLLGGDRLRFALGLYATPVDSARQVAEFAAPRTEQFAEPRVVERGEFADAS